MLWVWKNKSLIKGLLLRKKKNEMKEKNVVEGNIVEPSESNTVDVYVITESCKDLKTINFTEYSDKNLEWILEAILFIWYLENIGQKNLRFLNGLKWLWEAM